ncbi:hypothetical protein L1887_37173 [Cichorium endivia]|nr:hypothetical protein L1887_37173 [Cichorium endivia]
MVGSSGRKMFDTMENGWTPSPRVIMSNKSVFKEKQSFGTLIDTIADAIVAFTTTLQAIQTVKKSHAS